MTSQVPHSLASRTHALIVIWVGLLVTCFASGALAETQTFNDATSATAAGWSGERNNDEELGTAFGFAESNLAGGAGAGEAGGTFPRLKFPWAYYADTTLGGEISVTNPLMASGLVYFDEGSLNGGIDIGWMNTTGDTNMKAGWIGIEVLEDERFKAAVHLPNGGELLGTTINMHPTTTSEPFTINWDPTGGELGGGLLTVTIADAESTRDLTIEDAEAIGPLNAFGLLNSTGVGDNEPPAAGMLFVDDLSYSTAMTTGPEPGDYSGNGVVDAADYVLWREQNGTSVTAGTGADGTGDGNVNDADYAFWRERFGNPPGSGSGSVAGAVPEPTTIVLALLAGLAMCVWERHRH